MEEDFYKVLGVSRAASQKEIKSAYRKIARENHPDLNPDNKAAEERFKSATRAFEVLGDDERRKLYDEFGAAGLRDGFDPKQARQWQGGYGQGPFQYSYSQGSNPDFQDIFGSVFGGRSPFDTSDFSDFGGFYTGPMKGQDVTANLTLDFMTAVNGGELEIRVEGKSIKVRVPPGAAHGDKLRLKGQGGPAPSGAPSGSKAGDLLLSLSVQDHPHLQREGLNLYLDLPVTVAEAILGAKVPVPTPKGEYVVTIPEGVQSGGKLRLKGKGVTRGKKTGDFFVVVQIHTPDHIDDEIRGAASSLDAGYTTPVRANIKL